MKVEFTPAEVQPITKENIIVAGQVIGTVEFSKADPANYRMKDRYHAALKTYTPFPVSVTRGKPL